MLHVYLDIVHAMQGDIIHFTKPTACKINTHT